MRSRSLSSVESAAFLPVAPSGPGSLSLPSVSPHQQSSPGGQVLPPRCCIHCNTSCIVRRCESTSCSRTEWRRREAYDNFLPLFYTCASRWVIMHRYVLIPMWQIFYPKITSKHWDFQAVCCLCTFCYLVVRDEMYEITSGWCKNDRIWAKVYDGKLMLRIKSRCPFLNCKTSRWICRNQ